MSKELFMEVRQSTSNHFDKGRERYYIQQGADKDQLKQLKGDKLRWK